jgi:hypothetical protein
VGEENNRAVTSDKPSRNQSIAALATIILIAVVTYAYAVTLPFRIDDFVHFRWLYTRPLVDVWLSAAGLSYYRPLPFTVWKVIYWIANSYPAPLIHSINILLHATNGCLMLLLLWLHGKRNVFGLFVAWIAAVLFVLFPFSYQAVPWAGALSHPLVTLLMLASALMAIRGIERQSIRLKLVSFVLCLIAPFAHETGLLIAPVVTLFILTADTYQNLKQALKLTAVYWAAAAVAFSILVFFRLNGGLATSGLDLESRLQNGIYFLQGLLYPVAQLATQLRYLLPQLNDLGAVVIVCVPALIAMVYLSLRLGQGRRMLFAIGWYCITILPAWLMLPFAYVVDGPRLMYVAAVGAALLWTIPLTIFADRRWLLSSILRDKLLALTMGGLMTITIIGSIFFLRERADMYEQTRRAADGLLGVVSSQSANETAVSINFPGFLAPKFPTYALGHEGVSFIPNYSSVVDLVWTMTGKERNVANFVVQELQSEWRYNYRNYGPSLQVADLQPSLRSASRVLFTSDRRDNLATYNVGSLIGTNQMTPTEYVSTYGGQLTLLKGTWERLDDTLHVTLQWHSLRKFDQEVRTYVHLQTDSGELIAQEDGLPLMGLSSPIYWLPGDQWRDMRVVVLPGGIKPGRYIVRVGVYPASGGARIPAIDSTGKRFENDSATVGEFIVP